MWWTVGATALVIMAVVAAVLTASWRSPVADRAHTAEELNAQAGTIVAQVFSAEASTWRADREQARKLVTDSFATSIATALTASPPEGVQSVRWEPTQVGVVDAQADSGTALVVARVVVTSLHGEQTSETKSVDADFVRVDGRWLLTGLDELQ